MPKPLFTVTVVAIAVACAAGGAAWLLRPTPKPLPAHAPQVATTTPVTPPLAMTPTNSQKPAAQILTPEQREAENARLRSLISEALRSLATAKPPVSSAPPIDAAAASVWRQGLDEMARSAGDFDARLAVAEKMARLGRAGVDCLKSVAQDRGRDIGERDAAVRVLSLIRSRDALAAVVGLREPDVMELDYPYDLVMLQVASLPTRDVRGFVPDVLKQIDGELGADTLAPERPELLAILALAHGDRGAQTLLYDERILRDNLAGAVSAANDIHTPAAREFLDWLAEQGAGTSAGDLGQILAEW